MAVVSQSTTFSRRYDDMRVDRCAAACVSGEEAAAAFAGGWFHSGDAAVVRPDGYVEIRDRFKDVIISGGENISSAA